MILGTPWCLCWVEREWRRAHTRVLGVGFYSPVPPLCEYLDGRGGSGDQRDAHTWLSDGLNPRLARRFDSALFSARAAATWGHLEERCLSGCTYNIHCMRSRFGLSPRQSCAPAPLPLFAHPSPVWIAECPQSGRTRRGRVTPRRDGTRAAGLSESFSRAALRRLSRRVSPWRLLEGMHIHELSPDS